MVSFIFVLLAAGAAAAAAQRDGGCERDRGACLAKDSGVDEEALLQHGATLREVSKHLALATCSVGAAVACSTDGSASGWCSGNQCCLGTSGKTYTCPSASIDHAPGCSHPKSYDCTGSSPTSAPPQPTPGPAPTLPTKCDTQPNPPSSWGQGTYIFSPTDNQTDIQAKINAAYASNGGQRPPNNGQFSDKRFAFLFQPGEYKVDVPVGFYTTVAGMGDHPDKVVFSGNKGVYCEQGARKFDMGALQTFWRSAENFKMEASHNWWGSETIGMLWAVSQAAPLRRVHAIHDVWVAQFQDRVGYASGGFMADSKVEGKLQFMGQQQWASRNVEASGFVGGAWSITHIGNSGNVPAAQCPPPPNEPIVTVQPTTPKVAEKPYIVSDGKKFSLHVPAVRTDSTGPSWAGDAPQDAVISFEHVYVATAADSAAAINEKIACENVQALVLTAGIYHLDEAILVDKPGFVVLGLGMATLKPTHGTAAITVAGGIGNVRLASVLLEAGWIHSKVLLDWGSPDKREAPTSVISDLFVRNGGPDHFQTFVETFVHIKTNNVIGDNLWLWRADHSVMAAMADTSSMFPTDNGLVVDGDNCIMYGLAVEHTLKTLTTWNGEGGQTYLYQSELPYGVFDTEFGKPGYVGYLVSPSVKTHKAMAIGVYSNFYNDVTVENGISAPTTATFTNALTVHLDEIGEIKHVINGQGGASTVANQGHFVVVCSPSR